MSVDPVLEAVRRAARAAVSDASLRAVAREIGISHPALGEFIADGSERAPYGPSRKKLIEWADRAGVRLPSGHRVAEPQHVWGGEMIPPSSYNRIFDLCAQLKRAKVPDATIEEARRLLSGELVPMISFGARKRRREEDWVAFVDRAWALVQGELLRSGYKL